MAAGRAQGLGVEHCQISDCLVDILELQLPSPGSNVVLKLVGFLFRLLMIGTSIYISSLATLKAGERQPFPSEFDVDLHFNQSAV
jgi:hypothetical protein